jgi:hypothetical protein
VGGNVGERLAVALGELVAAPCDLVGVHLDDALLHLGQAGESGA